MKDNVNQFRGQRLTGLADLKGTLEGKDVVIGCSGPTFSTYDDHEVPDHVIRVGLNEGIRKWTEDGKRPADYWVFSDTPILEEYSHLYQEGTKCLIMHEATQSWRRFIPKADVYTVNSMEEIREYDNPYQFFSRATVMIGAVEMLRYMGAKRFFIFGLDCFRTDKGYYFDGRTPIPNTEKRTLETERVRAGDAPAGMRLFLTSKLRRMVDKLDKVKASGLWDGIEVYCVSSPYSQQRALAKITFAGALDLWKETDPEGTSSFGQIEVNPKPPEEALIAIEPTGPVEIPVQKKEEREETFQVFEQPAKKKAKKKVARKAKKKVDPDSGVSND